MMLDIRRNVLVMRMSRLQGEFVGMSLGIIPIKFFVTPKNGIAVMPDEGFRCEIKGFGNF